MWNEFILVYSKYTYQLICLGLRTFIFHIVVSERGESVHVLLTKITIIITIKSLLPVHYLGMKFAITIPLLQLWRLLVPFNFVHFDITLHGHKM